mgnify:FL=1
MPYLSNKHCKKKQIALLEILRQLKAEQKQLSKIKEKIAVTSKMLQRLQEISTDTSVSRYEQGD